MKIIFSDATEINVQQVESHGDYLRILTVGNTPEQLKVLFTDASRTARMIVRERGQTVATYEGYTAFYRTEIYTGNIYGVMMYKQETLPAVKSEIQQAAILVARMQAQSLDDAQALTVKAIYPRRDEVIGQAVKQGFKFLYNDILFKVIQPDGLIIQEQYIPGEGTESLYAVINETNAGTQEDPIPYAGNMALENGKYYGQDGVIYLCNRDTEIPVYQALKDLVGLYVEVAE
mgnify:CR=1 FL=1